ncbi:uncharacterized protein SPPG_03774 [Spizellomyces punctatus DAOM BR117]|uniref:DUF2231 domain-containing protein n=1 Tax=Spizellomyces punctatus (strain DAOM BR117) TaxID=645134 RepID=A0A0L0HIJ5_SPIPD|nr:uncharacterized protein SPPG_03774 [Spizellomyces punctatus DAOM BR117]KND00649.1 hypothetical protein SPPG_03774 [Spizellomyces punctatus DAOM BR117]|eukprot:XP_016608688.1 hypothetical protein SPPG_03774 [Spizellomyces punctatus DAOM BR117]
MGEHLYTSASAIFFLQSTMPSITKYVWSILLGHVGENAHPLHPAVVHVPATLYPVAFASDVVGLFMDRFPPVLSFVTSRGLYAFSYYATAASLISTIPAALTGFAEFFTINKERSPEANRTAYWHAGLNISAVAIALFNFLTKRQTVDFAPYKFNIFLSGVGLTGVLYSVYLGGTLVYKHGVGVRRMGEGKKAKVIEGNPNYDLDSELGVPQVGKGCC